MTDRRAAHRLRRIALGRLLAIGCVLATGAIGAAAAQAQSGAGRPALADVNEAKAARDAADDAARLSQESAAAARIQAEKLARDQAKLSEALARIGRKVVARETALGEARQALDGLRREIAGAQARLLEQREALQRLLGRIQRAAREPTPSLVIQPNRPVAAARSAMLLGALSRQALDARRNAESEIERISAATAEARRVETSAQEELAALRRDEAEVKKLLEVKRAARRIAAATAGDAAAEADRLARRARALADQVEALAARPAPVATAPETKPKARLGAASAPSPPPDYGIRFSKAQGALVRPVAGRAYKVDRGAMRGMVYESAPYARVVAPWGGVVLYPKRTTSNGEIVIIEPQKGYQLLLFGLSSIDVQEGDRLSPGEPIGRMGGPPPESDEFLLEMTAGNDAAPERLYFEIHARGEPVDASLWMESSTRKVSGL